MENEIWVSIKGYKDLYEVSSFGRVRSLDRLVLRRSDNAKVFKHGCVLVQSLKSVRIDEMFKINLSKDGVKEQKEVHRLVAKHFLVDDDIRFNVKHIDGNTLNNNINNLKIILLEVSK